MTTIALKQTKTNALLQILFGSLILALSAHAKIYLPFTIVPITLAPTVAVTLGILLGPTRGAAAVALYILYGTCGLPVFANSLGLFGPTAGFLLGYIPGAYLAGRIAQRGFTGYRKILAYLVGHLPIYALGLAVLSLFIGWDKVLLAGFFPFLPGCFLKSFFCASFIRR